MLAVNATIVGHRPTGLGVFALEVVRALAALGEPLTIHTSRPELVAGLGAIRLAPAATRPERGGRGHLARLLWVQTVLRARVRRSGTAALFNPVPEGILGCPVPQVVTVLDVLALRFPESYPRLRFYFRHAVPRLLRHAGAIVTISEASRQDIVDLCGIPPERIHVAPCGYDPRRFTPDGEAAAAHGEPYVLYVGNVMPHKNLLRLVDAFAAADGPALRLVLRGDGRPEPVRALRERIARHRLEGRVDWRPYAEADELPALYRGARMLLLPSLWEGFGIPALEAMACGTPVIVSNTSALSEVVGDAGLQCDPLDVPALADAIRRVATDDRLAKDLRERGLARAPRFTWERTARAVQHAIAAARGR